MSWDAVAALANQFDRSVTDIFGAYINRQNVERSNAALTQNTENLLVAQRAALDTTNFYSKTAGLDALLESHASQYSGIGQAQQNSQLLHNTDAMVHEQGLAFESRASQTLMDVTTQNTKNSVDAMKSNQDDLSFVQTAHAVGGLMSMLPSALYLLMKGGDKDFGSVAERALPDAVEQRTVNQNTGYAGSGMADPTSAGHHEFVQNDQNSVYDTITSSTGNPSSLNTDTHGNDFLNWLYSDGNGADSMSVNSWSYLSNRSDASSPFNTVWYPNSATAYSNNSSEGLTDDSVSTAGSSTFDATWYPNGAQEYDNRSSSNVDTMSNKSVDSVRPESDISSNADTGSLYSADISSPNYTDDDNSSVSTTDPTPQSSADVAISSSSPA